MSFRKIQVFCIALCLTFLLSLTGYWASSVRAHWYSRGPQCRVRLRPNRTDGLYEWQRVEENRA